MSAPNGLRLAVMIAKTLQGATDVLVQLATSCTSTRKIALTSTSAPRDFQPAPTSAKTFPAPTGALALQATGYTTTTIRSALISTSANNSHVLALTIAKIRLEVTSARAPRATNSVEASTAKTSTNVKQGSTIANNCA